MLYKKLKIEMTEMAGVRSSLRAMRFPKDNSKGDSTFCLNVVTIGKKDKALAKRLIKAGNEHAKFVRGIDVWIELYFQAGFMIELETYRIGIDTLSTSSSMHNELKNLIGVELAEQKQKDLSTKVYHRISKVSYQTLRKMYKERRNHKHPDWQIFCDFIETLPFFDIFIYPEFINTKDWS